jgi:hypothetical protein
MTEKAFTGGTDPLVEDLGDGTHVPIVKVRGVSTSGPSATGDGLTEAQLLAAGLALDGSVQSTNTSLGTDGATPPAISGTGVRGWLRGIYEKLAGTLAVSLDIDVGAGAVTAKTRRVTLASDGPVVTSIGGTADSAAAADGTGNYSVLSALKRGLLNWATLLSRIPTQVTPGLLPVDTLGTPVGAKVQATSSAVTSIALATTCRRISVCNARRGIRSAAQQQRRVTVAAGERPISMFRRTPRSASCVRQPTAQSITE